MARREETAGIAATGPRKSPPPSTGSPPPVRRRCSLHSVGAEPDPVGLVDWIGAEVAPLVTHEEPTRYVLAIDQGTTSSRAILFDHAGELVATGQREHPQHFPRAGWVEHDAAEIRDNVMRGDHRGPGCRGRLGRGRRCDRHHQPARDRGGLGSRDRRADLPAIVWQDTRTQNLVDSLAADGGTGRFREQTGLPLATYFSATKIAWILDNVEGARARAEAGELAFGTTTPGCSGTSPAARTAACTPPTSRTPAARC